MNFKLAVLASIISLGAYQSGHAANVTNNITGVGPKNALVNPYFCIQDENGNVTYALAPGKTVDANKYSGNKYYVGGALRFGGCKESDSYLGYLGLQVNDQHNNKVSTYSAPGNGVHIAYADGAIDGNGNLTGKIRYTAIDSNFTMKAPAQRANTDLDFVGFNLSGLEFGKVIDPMVIPNLSQVDQASAKSDLSDTQAFLSAGMNVVRVPISWGFLQLEGPGKGELNMDYYNSYVKPLLESLTAAKTNVIVDLHAYMRYSEFGKEYSGCGESGKCPDGTLILDPKAYQDVWVKLYSLIKDNSKINKDYIMLDLMNEPVDVPNDSVFTIQAEVIKSLRQQDFKGYILVEGNSWSGLHSWTNKKWKSTDGKTTYTNADLFSRENFAKSGITDLSKILINAHQYLDSDYSGTQNTCLTDLSTTDSEGNAFNLNMFVDYLQKNHLKAIVTEFGAGQDEGTCKIALKKFLDYMKDNAAKDKDYGFVGWTVWSTGHGWGDDYKLKVTPTSYKMSVMQGYL